MPVTIEKAVLTSAAVLRCTCRAVYVPGKNEKSVFTGDEVL